MNLSASLSKRADAMGALAGETRLLSGLRPKDIETIRDAALSTGTRAALGLGGLGAYAIAREKLKGRHEQAHESEMDSKYTEMMAKNPHLAKHDPEKTKEWFSIMSKYAPDMASHPHVAGSWVGSQIEYGDKVPFSAVSDLIQAQKAHEQTTQGRVGTSTVAAIIGGSAMPGMKMGK